MSSVVAPTKAVDVAAGEGIPAAPSGTMIEELAGVFGELKSRIGTILLGKDDVVDDVLLALLSGGSILLEDVPGVGKTTLAKAVTGLMGLQFGRVQCTPDLLPADILGGPVYRPNTGEFEFRPGPIFCNLLIADEVNRASPRTQSALLEAMAESQVTIDGTRYPLKRPFMVIATQNPDGFEGTFALPESQLDRFLIRIRIDYPDADSEADLLMGRDDDDAAIEQLQPMISHEDLIRFQDAIRAVSLSREVADYLVAVVTATRQDNRVGVGVSPRGSKMWLRAARARAAMAGRTYVLPDDLQSTAPIVLVHRMVHAGGGGARDELDEVLRQILDRVAVPV